MFDPSDRAELLGVFRDEAAELVQSIDADLLRLESLVASGENDAELINSLFRALHTIKGSAGMLELHEVSSLAHGLESACGLLRSGSLRPSKLIVEALFEGRDLLTALIRCGIEASLPPPAGTTETFLQHLEAALDGSIQVRQEPAPSVKPRDQTRRSTEPARGRTIRVEIARLDKLLDLVGELVIAKNRILQLAATPSAGNDAPAAYRRSEWEAAAAQLARTTADLQEGVMRARMVRIAGVFERFPRLVRDLAKAQGKEISLIIEGAETDLDKTIVDELGEPLMHLVRNCVDHGIESPKRRRESDKAPAGTLRMRAFHDGNTVVVEVSDDGGGIDLERVRERGRALGFIRDGEEPDEHALLELLFVPGFSTARNVTEISGRGIGMDVVRRVVAGLSGTLEVSSRPGRGTAFTIRLPLTLAILHAMLVRIADAIYALPVEGIAESLRLEASEVQSDRSGEFVTHRERKLPIIRGAEFFELGAPRSDGPKALIVVVTAGGREIGLVVDEFLGEQEVVVKPLSDFVGSITGISGGTILGDGAIALIVDPIALVNQAHRAIGSILVSASSR